MRNRRIHPKQGQKSWTVLKFSLFIHQPDIRNVHEENVPLKIFIYFNVRDIYLNGFKKKKYLINKKCNSCDK